jgi:exopolyphosphatase/guanosine-5'-triphosphate,3'-diphosphate pyrophosphatase
MFRNGRGPGRFGHVFAALDLGTNNCRLLIARPTSAGFRVIDAFSRIVRLGEGLTATGALSQHAMDRAIAALRICADKMERRGVTLARQVATEACRVAANADLFVARVREEVGLTLDVISPGEEAELAVAGCVPLLDSSRRHALIFDIGGGSTELMWLDLDAGLPRLRAWTSLPCGVVTMSERHGGAESPADFEAAVGEVAERLHGFGQTLGLDPEDVAESHVIGTSGTVTTLAGIHLGLPRYERARVDGVWLDRAAIETTTRGLCGMAVQERAQHPCIGPDRADLVLAGCAILEGIHRTWPHRQLQVADRGLREGMLLALMEAADRAPVRREQPAQDRPGPAELHPVARGAEALDPAG